jgi:hypothetical protein
MDPGVQLSRVYFEIWRDFERNTFADAVGSHLVARIRGSTATSVRALGFSEPFSRNPRWGSDVDLASTIEFAVWRRCVQKEALKLSLPPGTNDLDPLGDPVAELIDLQLDKLVELARAAAIGTGEERHQYRVPGTRKVIGASHFAIDEQVVSAVSRRRSAEDHEAQIARMQVAGLFRLISKRARLGHLPVRADRARNVAALADFLAKHAANADSYLTGSGEWNAAELARDLLNLAGIKLHPQTVKAVIDDITAAAVQLNSEAEQRTAPPSRRND